MKLPVFSFLPVLLALALVFPLALQGQDAPTPDRSSKEAAKGPSIKPKGTIKKALPRTLLVGQAKKKLAEVTPSGILILVEWIEVEHEDFSDWVFENKLTPDATNLRKEVQRWKKDGDAEVIRTVVVHAQNGQRAKVESISEFIYATEYDPPEVPNEPNLSDKSELPVTPATGAAFETRNLGTTVEVDPVLEDSIRTRLAGFVIR